MNYKKYIYNWKVELSKSWTVESNKSFGKKSGNYECRFCRSGERYKETFFKTALLIGVVIIRRKLLNQF